MAQNYTLMARKNLLKPDETPNVLLIQKENWKVVSVSSCSK